MAHEILQLKQVHPTVGYSHVARAGNTLYIAGQIAKDLAGNIVGVDNLETQVRQTHTNLKTILEEAGGSLGNVVKLTTFLTHYGYIEGYRKVRGELIVESLAFPELMIEVEAIAVLD